MHMTPLALGTTSCLLKEALETNYSLHEFSPFFHKLGVRLSASAFVVSVVQYLTNFKEMHFLKIESCDCLIIFFSTQPFVLSWIFS